MKSTGRAENAISLRPPVLVELRMALIKEQAAAPVFHGIFTLNRKKAVIFTALFITGFCALCFHAIDRNYAPVTVAIDYSGIKDQPRAAVLFLSVEGKPAASITKDGRLAAAGYLKTVMFSLPKDPAKTIKQLRIGIGKQTFIFSGAETAAFPPARIAAGSTGGLIVELPGTVHAPASIFGKAFSGTINWGGDLPLFKTLLSSAGLLLLLLCALAGLEGLWREFLRERVTKAFTRFEQRASYPAWEKAAGALVCVAAITVFNLLFFNRFFQLPEGWFTMYGRLILEGKIPYRDFYLFIPPLHPLFMAGVTAIFGNNFICFRILGLAIMAVQVWMIYLIFLRLFRPAVAMLAAFFSALIHETHCAFGFYDYNDCVNLYVLGLTLLTLRFTESGASLRRRMGQAALMGAIAAACILTKHTIGVLLFLSCFTILGLAERGKTESRPWKVLLSFLLGAAAAALPVLLWLAHNGALSPMLRQLFLERGEKGTVAEILFRWVPNFFGPRSLISLALVSPLFFYLRFKPDLRAPEEQEPDGLYRMTVYALCAAAAVLLPYLLPALGKYLAASKPLTELFRFNIFLSSLLTFCVLVFALYGIARGRGGRAAFSLAAVLSSAAMLCLSSAMSSGSGIQAYGTLLASGFLAGTLLTGSSRSRGARTLFCVVLAAMVFFMTSFRLANVFGRSPTTRWWGVGEQGSVWDPSAKFSEKALRGFSVSPAIVAAIDGVEGIIEQRSSKDDVIFTYPHIPLFYTLSGRQCPTFSIMHWYDTVNSRICARDAETLLKAAPKVIVCLHYLNGRDLLIHEMVYNGWNELSGHRAMMQAIVTLASDKKLYRFEKSFEIEKDCVIDVYSRI